MVVLSESSPYVGIGGWGLRAFLGRRARFRCFLVKHADLWENTVRRTMDHPHGGDHHFGGFSVEETRDHDRRRLVAEAHRARNRGRDRRAIALYRRVLIEEPRNVDVALRAAPLLAYRGESFEAWQLFRIAVTELLRAKRYEACLGVLREACRCVPHEFDAWRRLARLQLKLGGEDAG